MGRPVVATSLGAEGLAASAGEELLVADEASACAGAIARLLGDPALAARVGAAGRALVEARFDWNRIADDHERIYETALAGPDAPLALPHDRSLPLARVARLLPMPANAALGATLLAQRGLRWYLRARR